MDKILLLILLLYCTLCWPLLMHHQASLIIEKRFVRLATWLFYWLWNSTNTQVKLVAILNLIWLICAQTIFISLRKVWKIESTLEMSLITHLILEALHLAPTLISPVRLRKWWRWLRYGLAIWKRRNRSFCIADIKIWICLCNQLRRYWIVVLWSITWRVFHSLCRSKFIWIQTCT